MKNNSVRNNLPIGVHYNKIKNLYTSECNNGTGKTKHLGCYNTPYEAFNAYKVYKENLIKQIAKEEFEKGNITEKCYKAMIKYKVEITD